jgi:hypothetical protein
VALAYLALALFSAVGTYHRASYPRLAPAQASLARREVIFRSAWATTAMMPIVSSLASGMSAATNLTPAFYRPSRKCVARQTIEAGDDERRSIAPRNRMGQLRPTLMAPDSTSTNSEPRSSEKLRTVVAPS